MYTAVKYLKANFTTLALVVIAILVILGACLILFNRSIIDKNLALQKQTEIVKKELRYSHDEITRYVDITLRGYAIIRQERYLYISHAQIEQLCEANFHRLDSLLAAQGYDDAEGLKAVKDYQAVIRDFVNYHGYMVDLLRKDSIELFKIEFDRDKGAGIGPVYKKATDAIHSFEDELHHNAQRQYELAMQGNIYVQLLVVLLGLPTIVWVLTRLRQENTNRRQLLAELEENNRKFLFNSGTKMNAEDPKLVIQQSIHSLQKASDFVASISNGNYQVNWDELTEQNQHLNQSNLAGRLIQMREQMKKVKLEDEKRLWANEGLAQFSALVRNHQHDQKLLSDQCIRFLTKYLNAQQGSLFVVTNIHGTKELELAACYAFDRKKFVEKRIEIGAGLVGQTYLEGETVLLTDIPQGYTTITSGLGDATPACLVIVPMKYNDITQAILELASFVRFDSHQVTFLERCGEFLASALLSVKTTSQMKLLLEQSQEQAEEMRAQEEEMRQNMEELAATQEEMSRKSQEMEMAVAEKTQRLSQLEVENQLLKQQLAATVPQ